MWPLLQFHDLECLLDLPIAHVVFVVGVIFRSRSLRHNYEVTLLPCGILSTRTTVVRIIFHHFDAARWLCGSQNFWYIKPILVALIHVNFVIFYFKYHLDLGEKFNFKINWIASDDNAIAKYGTGIVMCDTSVAIWGNDFANLSALNIPIVILTKK